MNPLARFFRYAERKNPFFLAHHPRCEYYSHHTFELYGTQLCMGCFIVYPVGGLSLALLALTRAVYPSLFALDTPGFYAAAALLATPLFVAKAASGQRSSRTRIVTKGLLALGAASLFFPLLFRPADRLVTAAIIATSLVAYVGHKGVTAFDDCEGCPQADDFPNCTGMELDEER